MPLHLLGKKSWNVYNADNIARVRRDEAAAKAAEEGEEQRMQEIDAQRRLAILRGEEPPPIEEPEPHRPDEPSVRNHDASHSGGMRRKRKRPGEDDTDFEMRIARENDSSTLVRTEPERKGTSSAPIMDHNGHIDLLGDEKSRAYAEKNEEAEKEAKKKKRSYEDQYMMRFTNAAGKDGAIRPWYSQSDAAAPDASSKDVWGNQDPNRKERDAKRIVSNDPLAMMKQGASKVRELKQDRKRFQQEREEELKKMRRDERHREKKQRRHEGREGSRERNRSRDRDRDRDRERSPDRRERRHRSRERRNDRDRQQDSRTQKYEHHGRERSRHGRRRHDEGEARREKSGRDDKESRDKRDLRSRERTTNDDRVVMNYNSIA